MLNCVLFFGFCNSVLKTYLLCTLNVQVIPAFEEAVSGLALGALEGVSSILLEIFDAF